MCAVVFYPSAVVLYPSAVVLYPSPASLTLAIVGIGLIDWEIVYDLWHRQSLRWQRSGGLCACCI